MPVSRPQPPSTTDDPSARRSAVWRRRAVRLAAWTLATLVPVSAMAGDIFLNGVKVTGMTNQDFEGAKVRFDEKGNVHISVPGVKVHFEGQPGPGTGQTAAPTPAVAGQYFLVSTQTSPGRAQYDVDVHVNGNFVTRIANDQAQVTLNISKHLRPGINTVVFTSIKNIGARRLSFSGADELNIIVGRGTDTARQLTIDEQLVTYKRTAAHIENHTQSFEFTVR